MVFGSFVAGATSMGGGAVAFPVLTKLLAVAPENAKLFSLAIQSVGMTSASFTIVLMRLPVLWRVILPASVTGAVGMLIGLVWLSPVVPAAEIRVFFYFVAGRLCSGVADYDGATKSAYLSV